MQQSWRMERRLIELTVELQDIKSTIGALGQAVAKLTPKDLVNLTDAAKLLGVSRSAFYRLQAGGKIPAPVVNVKRRPMFSRDDILRLKAELKGEKK